jgi:hypothetical protein
MYGDTAVHAMCSRRVYEVSLGTGPHTLLPEAESVSEMAETRGLLNA